MRRPTPASDAVRVRVMDQPATGEGAVGSGVPRAEVKAGTAGGVGLILQGEYLSLYPSIRERERMHAHV